MSDKLRPRQFPDVKGIFAEDFLGNGTLACGSAVPSDAAAGYAPGCIWFKTGASTGDGHYINRGSATSCSFKKIDLGGIDLSTLTATATELNTLTGITAIVGELNRIATLLTRRISFTASATLAATTHSDKMLCLNAIAGLTITLPAPTGSGARYDIVVETAVTSNGYIISSTGANIFGNLAVSDDTGVGNLFTLRDAHDSAGATTITLDGTTKGGRKGDRIFIEDRLAAGYVVTGRLQGSGTEDSPFS